MENPMSFESVHVVLLLLLRLLARNDVLFATHLVDAALLSLFDAAAQVDLHPLLLFGHHVSLDPVDLFLTPDNEVGLLVVSFDLHIEQGYLPIAAESASLFYK